MATTDLLINSKVQNLFENLESQKNLLTKCINLHKTLTSHFTTLQQSIDSKTLTLESNFESLDSHFQESLNNFNERDNSIPNKLSTLSSEIESKRDSAIAELEKPIDEKAQLSEVLKSLCRRMDHSHLLRFVISRRKEMNTLRWEMREALKECVDPTRMVLECVKEFTEAKVKAKRGVADKRWACGVVVTGLFPLEELKEEKKKKNVGPMFARKTVEEAVAVVRDWREKAEKAAGGGGGSLMGSAEAVMLLQVVVGFGLKGIIEEEYCKNLVVEFASRRDMAKLAVPIFGDKVADLIDQLVRDGKEVEAVYFAKESGLADRFQPVSLLKSYLYDSKKKTAEILKKGNNNAGATDEANNLEISYIRSIVRCVEDHKLEAEFSVDSLKKRLSFLEKAKADKKKGSTANYKPSNKRAQGSGGPPRSSGPHPPRPAKMRKIPSPYPSSYGQREVVSPALSPVSRYLGLSGQAAYDQGLTAPTYGPRFGTTPAPIADHITQQGQQHYGVPGGSVPSPGPRVSSSYGLQSAYGAYDYGAATASPYQPPYSQ